MNGIFSGVDCLCRINLKIDSLIKEFGLANFWSPVFYRSITLLFINPYNINKIFVSFNVEKVYNKR